ncbi:MAG: acyl-CoA desaturase [Actinomycetia bacterium]|nr:acyl-CoA desaturase [Actinomycetes bacterium]
MTAINQKPGPWLNDLDEATLAQLAHELDALRDSVLRERGRDDARYIRRVIRVQRTLELCSRLLLLASAVPPAWLAGTTGLSVAKILENMEIGHNVMHGQWDWMHDPEIHSSTWEWDNVAPSAHWKHTHNELHHQFTNVLGRDNDVGYNVLRMDEDQDWTRWTPFQLLYNVALAATFEYSIGMYGIESELYKTGEKSADDFHADAEELKAKIVRLGLRDYVLFPLLSGPSAPATLTANLTANLMRNLWTHAVIFCGHFPEGVETFTETAIVDESDGAWYLRQMLGSANISGGRLLHIMTGNLSFQIEHHLFPDLPSNRYQEIAPEVAAICARYGIPYTTGPMPQQVASAWLKVLRLSLPNPALAGVAGIRSRVAGLSPGRVIARLKRPIVRRNPAPVVAEQNRAVHSEH